jgi:penicillin-binding protein A
MRTFFHYKTFTLTVLFCLFAGIGISSLFIKEEKTDKQRPTTSTSLRSAVAKSLAPYLKENSLLPETILSNFDNENPQTYSVKYTVDAKLQKASEDLLKRYKPDYSAIFMMDAKTGRVLVYSSFQKEGPVENLLQKATYPAASIFKIVTATVAFDKTGLNPHDKIQFNGGNWTLYKKNVMLDHINRWTRTVSVREAFAKSMNTPFGKIGLHHTNPQDLGNYAERFLFNREIPADFPVDSGVAVIPNEKSFQLTEVAAGFNKQNRMSPVQGAIIAASVINGGKILAPFMIESLTDETGHSIYSGAPLTLHSAMNTETSKKIRDLMEETIISGTSRKTFSTLRRNKKFSEIEMGGKTGHLTGYDPKGTVDWFVGYASNGEKQVAIGVVTVNKKYWTVKSSYLGQSLFKKAFEEEIEIAGIDRVQ